MNLKTYFVTVLILFSTQLTSQPKPNAPETDTKQQKENEEPKENPLSTDAQLLEKIINFKSKSAFNDKRKDLRNEILNAKGLSNKQKEVLFDYLDNKNKEFDAAGEFGRFGFSSGFTYQTAWGDHRFVSGAYVNPLGIVQVRQSLRNITRVFPSFTGYFNFYTTKMFSVAFGFVTGVANGASNVGNGFAMTFGATLGFTTGKGVYIGIVRGQVYDPSVKKLPPYVEANAFHPILSRRPLIDEVTDNIDDNATAALILSEGIELPLESVLAVYDSFGVVIHFQL
jgi:hypothetical protein